MTQPTVPNLKTFSPARNTDTGYGMLDTLPQDDKMVKHFSED
ncbi:MAG: hypothetical protein ACP5HS_09620 [Anaerolineae bacterium]